MIINPWSFSLISSGGGGSGVVMVGFMLFMESIVSEMRGGIVVQVLCQWYEHDCTRQVVSETPTADVSVGP